MAGNSSSFQRCTASGFCWEARCSGRCGDNPIVRSSRPTLTTDKATENSRRITCRTISRVHNANSKDICRGSPRSTRTRERSAAPTVSAADPAPASPSANPYRPRETWPASHKQSCGAAPVPQRSPPDGPRPGPAPPHASAAPQASDDPVSGRRYRAHPNRARSHHQSRPTYELLSKSFSDSARRFLPCWLSLGSSIPRAERHSVSYCCVSPLQVLSEVRIFQPVYVDQRSVRTEVEIDNGFLVEQPEIL